MRPKEKEMTRFLAYYEGPTISSAQLLAVTANESIVRDFGRRLVGEDPGRRDDPPKEPPTTKEERFGDPEGFGRAVHDEAVSVGQNRLAARTPEAAAEAAAS